MHFEWDPRKAKKNLSKHGVSFKEASSAFYDALSTAGKDPDHSTDESRWVLFGESRARRLLVVSYVERGDAIRIISAREITPREREIYEEG